MRHNPDQRSTEAQAYRAWYKTARWQARRKAQLQSEPLCCRCEAKGRSIPATVADHVMPHKGDYQLFWYGDLQSMCKPCHDRHKQSEERRGYSKEVGLDGWPIDERHPCHKGFSRK